jgi:Prolipoprotein diacylglyceryl transferase
MPDVPGPALRIAGRPVVAFQLCGLTGLAAAAALSLALVVHSGGSALVMAAVIVLACLVFLALAMAQKVVTGTERLVYYHHEIAVLLAAAGLVAALDEAPLPYLDATAAGLGAFLAAGRCGCTLAGCCHGRPSRAGLRYGPRHVAEGFPAELQGVTLVPLQLVEAACAAALAALCAGLVLGDAAPGTALAAYVGLYAVARFGLEFARGDDVRPVVAGFSAAQWTSLAVLVATTGLASGGVLPGGGLDGVATVLVGATMTLVALARRDAPLFSAAHVRELAGALAAEGPQRTSLGISVSREETGGRRHYALASERGRLRDGSAVRLGRLVARLERLAEPVDVLRGASGTVMVVEGRAGQPISGWTIQTLGSQ